MTGHYAYSDPENDPELGTIKQWKDSVSGVVSNISGAVTNTFTLDMAQGGKYIAFFLTPKNANGTGTATRSAWHYVNAAPTIQNLVVKNPTNPGVFAVDETIEANFTYSDLENNPEGTHIFQWYRATTSYGTGATVISGATSKQYTLVQLIRTNL